MIILSCLLYDLILYFLSVILSCSHDSFRSVVLKMCSADPKGSATTSKGIHGYISVMAISKVACFCKLTFRGPCVLIYSYNKSQQDALFLKFIFDKELYMFQTYLLSIIRSLNTVYTAIVICHASYVDCLLARSRWKSILTSLADSQHN